jgi:uncharacterized delta-60 repeat protein
MHGRWWRAVVPALSVVGLLGVSVPSAGAAGALDPSFGSGGVVQLGSQAFGDAVASDGSVFATGTAGGAISLTHLSSSGQVLASSGGPAGTGRSVAVQSDGKVVVAGTGAGMVVARFNANGSPDTSFGGTGSVTVPGTIGGQGNAVGVTSNGKIVVAGSVISPSPELLPRIAVARLNANGSLDSSFSGGVVSINLTGGTPTLQYAEGLTVQGDGRVVIVGNLRPGFQVTNGFIARLTSSGAFDGSFGASGGNPNFPCGAGYCFYYHPLGGGFASLNAVTLQNDGKIVAAGVDVSGQSIPGEAACTTADCPHAVVVRLTSGGAPDGSFGGGGFAYAPAGRSTTTGNPIGAYGVVFAGKGDIIATGDFEDNGVASAALWAFTAAGSLDPAFGAGGTTITPMAGTPSHGRALAITADGSLVAAGCSARTCDSAAGGGGFVARYTGFGPPPAGGGGGGGGGGGAVAPAASTGGASSISPRSAKLNATLNPNGAATSYFFQFGTTSSYGHNTAGGTLPAGNANVSVAQSIGGLSPGVTYHFRVVAANAGGVSYGADRTFKPAFAISSPSVFGARTIKTVLAGLRVGVRCNDKCSIKGYLNVSSPTARKLGLKKGSLSIATGSGSLRGAGTKNFRLRLVKGIGSRVSRLSSLSATLRIVVSSPSRRGNLVATKTLAFKP